MSTFGTGFGSGGGGGSSSFIGLTDVPASYAGSSTKKVIVNVGETALEFIADSAGSAFPLPVKTIIDTNTTLTDADQGFIEVVSTGAAVTITLPATLTEGATFVISTAGVVEIDPNGNSFTNGLSATFRVPDGTTLTITGVIIGAPINASLWNLHNTNNLSTVTAYDAAVTYNKGDVVESTSIYYLHISGTPTVGTSPDDIIYWLRLTPIPVYPTNIVSVAADTLLTLADQGIVMVFASAVITLPATPPDGTEFTFLPAGATTWSIDANGATLAGATSPWIRGIDSIRLVSKFIAGPDIYYWVPIEYSVPVYDVTREYKTSDLVNDSGKFYLSMANSNIGYAVTNMLKWFPITLGGAEFFNYYSAGSTSITTGSTVDIPFDTAVISNSNYNTGSYAFIMPTGVYGVMEFTAEVYKSDSTADTGSIKIFISVNGSEAGTAFIPLALAIPYTVRVSSGPINIAEGDAIRIKAVNGGSSSHDIGSLGTLTGFSGKMIG